MKAFLLVGLLIWASLSARAQTYYLDLSGQVVAVPNRQVAVEQVVDGRPGHPAIGIAYRGLARKAASITFRQGLEPELTAFLRSQLPARPADHSVLLCLRSLHISETIGGAKEQATAELSADVYEALNGGYRFVRQVGALASSQGREVTGHHAGHLAALLSRSLGQLTAVDWSVVGARPAHTMAEIRANAPSVLAAGGRRGPVPPILTGTPRRGIYYHFEQFLANQPDTSVAFRIDTIRRRYKSPLATLRWHGVARVRPVIPNGTGRTTVPTDIWGFSDGQQLFVQYNKQFFPLMRQGGSFTFVGEAPLDLEYEQAATAAQLRTGLIGVAMLRAVNHTGEPLAYGLDLLTGAMGPYPGLPTSVRLDTAYLYLYRPAQATNAEPIKVYVDGQERGSLRPGTYLELSWARYGKPMQLCLGGLPALNSCQYLVPNVAQLSYLKINSANASHPWQWMTARQGSADLDELDKRAR
ncbi:hypothetical protein IC235_19830 [Hymenobacter sp. BT664]|uniref:Uncharacterized protein n=1 Tax=Hymenobacter montanus TaxID=2771359 RepID=A0A927BHS4_9BACT|nr:hypothetical protein [Hymenobacter montanus]MBD2770143.1 hypothetical protein [Hymenobacter montanus]